MGTVHELRLRSNRFVDQLDLHVESVINDNQALLDLNREQLRVEHKTKKDQPISPKYSRGYAAFKGFSTPDLYDTGELQRTLRIEAKGKAYNIEGTTDYSNKLVGWYGPDIYGVPISKQPDAKSITSGMLAELYRKFVLKIS